MKGKEIQDLFLSGKLSALEIASKHLEAIKTLDPQIGSFLSVTSQRVLKKAKELDEKKALGKPLGKLAAVPIAIKDNIHVEGEITTCGSKFLTNYKAPFSATVTRLIEEEDGLIIGKTNLDEFAMGSSTENSALLKTKNPWDLTRVPGGSSGGSATAVAARLCPLSLGSDTGGSIRQPASFTGIVGFKPTYGRVSRFGLVAYASSLDQIGPFARNTEDLALLMEVISAPCQKDSTHLKEPSPLFTKELKEDLKGIKIGVPWAFLEGLKEEPKNLFLTQIETLKALGAEIVSVDLSILKNSLAVYYILATAEASTNLARFDGIRYGVRSKEAKTLDEVYTLSKEEGFGKEVKRRILLGTYVLSSGYKEAYYKKALQARSLIMEAYKEAFSFCDLIGMPVTPTEAFSFGAHKDPLEMYLEDIYTISVNLAGVPAISVPGGFTKGNLPFGLQLIGPQKFDTLVVGAAHAFEKATDFTKKKPPVSAF
jgi:aspartyl-tRNA(Asn)/glutamyl-tRNA(Gln) amidotransferase subunit A